MCVCFKKQACFAAKKRGFGCCSTDQGVRAKNALLQDACNGVVCVSNRIKTAKSLNALLSAPAETNTVFSMVRQGCNNSSNFLLIQVKEQPRPDIRVTGLRRCIRFPSEVLIRYAHKTQNHVSIEVRVAVPYQRETPVR